MRSETAKKAGPIIQIFDFFTTPEITANPASIPRRKRLYFDIFPFCPPEYTEYQCGAEL